MLVGERRFYKLNVVHIHEETERGGNDGKQDFWGHLVVRFAALHILIFFQVHPSPDGLIRSDYW